MRKSQLTKTTGIAVVIGLTALISQPALGAGRLQNGPTVGDCISDGFYKNEPNVEGFPANSGPSEVPPGEKGGKVEPGDRLAATQSVGEAKKQGNDVVKDCQILASPH
jgi:hypothetical protein